MSKEGYDHWLEKTDYDKAIGQLRLQLNGVLDPFNLYGMSAYIPSAIEEIIQLTEQFGKRVRGKDTPILIRKR